MKLVAIAGPYRAPTEFGVLENIRRAEVLALNIWRMGCAVICPHKNTAHFGGAAPDETWLEGAREMVRRADAVVCVEGWRSSEGAKAEVDAARLAGIPVFETVMEFEAWFKSQESGNGLGGTETG